MSGDTYAHLYDQFTDTAFRLECLQTYAVHAEDRSTQAFREGLPRPERSVRTSPWLARIALDVAERGKDWSRVRLIRHPLTEYTRHELLAYVESQAAGERIDVAPASDLDYDGPDFWLFDAGTDHASAVELHYTEDGAVQRRVHVTDPADLAEKIRVRDTARAAAITLNEFLAHESAGKRG